MHGMRTVSHGPQKKSGLNRRIEDIGWGLLLVLTGGVLLVPDERIPQGSWLIGAGVILLGLNLVRSLNGIAINWFSTIMGILAFIAGAGEYYGVDLPLLPLFLIVIGASLIIKPLFREAR
jgi:hypothetical protein